MSERKNAVKTAKSFLVQPGNSIPSESQEEYFGMNESHNDDSPDVIGGGELVRSPFRTIHPPESPVVSGADSIRAVVDNVTHNIVETKAALEKNFTEAAKLQRRLEYLLKLQDIAEDYNNGK